MKKGPVKALLSFVALGQDLETTPKIMTRIIDDMRVACHMTEKARYSHFTESSYLKHAGINVYAGTHTETLLKGKKKSPAGLSLKRYRSDLCRSARPLGIWGIRARFDRGRPDKPSDEAVVLHGGGWPADAWNG
jgi:hypothetical protein